MKYTRLKNSDLDTVRGLLEDVDEVIARLEELVETQKDKIAKLEDQIYKMETAE